MKELKYPSSETINKLTKELKLEGADEFTQDWECEVANVNQLPEYIEYYQSKNLNINEKTTLMRIILEAYNDYVVLENEEYERICPTFFIIDVNKACCFRLLVSD